MFESFFEDISRKMLSSQDFPVEICWILIITYGIINEIIQLMDGDIVNKVNLKKEILTLADAVQKDEAEVNIMLVDQNNQRKMRYKGSMLRCKLEDVKNVILGSFKYLLDEIDRRTLDIYDLEISVDDSTQMVSKEDVIHGNEILAEMTVDYNSQNVITENTDLSKFKFMVIQIYHQEKQIFLFKKYLQPTAAYKTSQKYILSGGLLKPFAENIININSIVDAFLYDEAYFVFNRNAFNSIFAYKDVFAKILNDNIDVIKESGLLTDAESFVMDCESDGRYLTKLTKVILAKGFIEVTKSRAEIPGLIKEFDLSLKINDNGEILYRGKEDIPELMNLLLRHYVIDALTSSKMIAAAIQEYKAGK